VSSAMDSEDTPVDYSDYDSQPEAGSTGASGRTTTSRTSGVTVNAALRSSGGSVRESGGMLRLSSASVASASTVSGRRLRDFDATDDSDSPLIGSIDRHPVASSLPGAKATPFVMAMASNLMQQQLAGPGNAAVDDRLQAIELPTVHSRRPSKESVNSDTNSNPVGGAGAGPSRFSPTLTGANQQQQPPKPAKPTAQPQSGNASLSLTSATVNSSRAATAGSEVALGNTNTTNNTAISDPRSASSVSSRSASGRYSGADDDDDADEKEPVRIVRGGSGRNAGANELAQSSEEKLEFRRQQQQLQQQQGAASNTFGKPRSQRKDDDDDEDDLDSKPVYRTGTKTNSGLRADEKNNSASIDNFSDTGFVSNITDDFSNTGNNVQVTEICIVKELEFL
jgi:hypothetical protein